MRLRAPKFWFEPAGMNACALSPFSFLYSAGRHLHQYTARPYKAKIPVICAGNLVIGGSGKTPVAIALMQMVRNKMLADNPCFLSRGYGGQLRGHFLVNRDLHTVQDVGDEALLLERRAPTIIAASRKRGALYAENNGFDLIIMDDGLQNPGLHKDLSFVVADGMTGFGNGMLLPAGPLRESLKQGLARADAVILLGDDESNVQAALPGDIPVFRAHVNVSENWIANPDIPYVAFCGLAHPDKFRRSLERAGINIVEWRPFPDHYAFSMHELRGLAEKAKEHDARLITTEKDAVRIPSEFARELPLDILPVEVKWEDAKAVTAFLKEKTGKA